MQGQPSATCAPQFVVEVEYPRSPDPDGETIRCESVSDLAAELDEHPHWGQGVRLEIAQRVAAGGEFEDDADDLEVTARMDGGRV